MCFRKINGLCYCTRTVCIYFRLTYTCTPVCEYNSHQNTVLIWKQFFARSKNDQIVVFTSLFVVLTTGVLESSVTDVIVVVTRLLHHRYSESSQLPQCVAGQPAVTCSRRSRRVRRRRRRRERRPPVQIWRCLNTALRFLAPVCECIMWMIKDVCVSLVRPVQSARCEF